MNKCGNRFSGEQSCCSLCRERLRSQHSCFGQWTSELQHFLLLNYTEIPEYSLYKACERIIRTKTSCPTGIGSYPVNVFIFVGQGKATRLNEAFLERMVHYKH